MPVHSIPPTPHEPKSGGAHPSTSRVAPAQRTTPIHPSPSDAAAAATRACTLPAAHGFTPVNTPGDIGGWQRATSLNDKSLQGTFRAAPARVRKTRKTLAVLEGEYHGARATMDEGRELDTTGRKKSAVSRRRRKSTELSGTRTGEEILHQPLNPSSSNAESKQTSFDENSETENTRGLRITAKKNSNKEFVNEACLKKLEGFRFSNKSQATKPHRLDREDKPNCDPKGFFPDVTEGIAEEVLHEDSAQNYVLEDFKDPEMLESKWQGDQNGLDCRIDDSSFFGPASSEVAIDFNPSGAQKLQGQHQSGDILGHLYEGDPNENCGHGQFDQDIHRLGSQDSASGILQWNCEATNEGFNSAVENSVSVQLGQKNTSMSEEGSHLTNAMGFMEIDQGPNDNLFGDIDDSYMLMALEGVVGEPGLTDDVEFYEDEIYLSANGQTQHLYKEIQPEGFRSVDNYQWPDSTLTEGFRIKEEISSLETIDNNLQASAIFQPSITENYSNQYAPSPLSTIYEEFSPSIIEDTTSIQQLIDGDPTTETVIENFLPPSSLQYSFNDDSQDGQTFNSDLPAPDSLDYFHDSDVSLTTLDMEFPGQSSHEHIFEQPEATNSVDSEIEQPNEDSEKIPPARRENGENLNVVGDHKRLNHKVQKGKTKRLVSEEDASWKNEPKKRRIRIIDPSRTRIHEFLSAKNVPFVPHIPPSPSGHEKYDKNGNMKPFVRPPFQAVVKGRSNVDGLSPRTVIKTCFRVGEVLRVAGMMAASGIESSGNENTLLELYARITFSERLGMKQNFQFRDLFHDQPPFLSGTYELFKACELWNHDSATFLGEPGKGKMARIVGRMRRKQGEGALGFTMQILNIWEADWSDLEYIRGVTCGSQ